MSADRFALTVAALAGEPWPALPALPGVVHQCRDDAFTPDDKDELLMSDATDAEIGRLFGVTRQRINQLRQKLRQAETPGAPSGLPP